MVCAACLRRCFTAILALAILALATESWGQPWINPGGVGDPPPSTVTYSTNRLDLDADGTNDFEITHEQAITYSGGFGGWQANTAMLISLVPLGGCQILVSDVRDAIAGDIPILIRGDAVGVATAGRHWGSESRVLVNRVEPWFLFGPLSSIWIGAPIPAESYIGISLGTPEAPRYGWLRFTRDRGIQPASWGFARAASGPVEAGDLRTAPAIAAKLTRIQTAAGEWPRLTWEPGFADVTVEQLAPIGGAGWTKVENPSDPTFRSPMLNLGFDAPTGEARLFRVRLAP